MEPTPDVDASYASDSGATAVEYALIVSAIAAVIVVVVIILGGTVNHMFSNSCAAVNSDGVKTVATTDCG
jgi:Flp pilus assembly pilin Flp